MSKRCLDCIHDKVCMHRETKSEIGKAIHNLPAIFVLDLECKGFYEKPRYVNKPDDPLVAFKYNYPETPQLKPMRALGL